MENESNNYFFSGGKILIACEESQTICTAFRERGFEAYSCDIQPASGGYPEWHIQDDVLNHLSDGWDLMIGHPPCTYLSYAGTQHWNNPGRIWKRLEALEFFAKLWEAPIPHICLENPKSVASPVIAKYSQEIQPWYFGDQHIKTTWLWLKNLPKLQYSLTGDLFSEKTATEKPEPLCIDYTGKKRYITDYISGSKNGGFKRSKTFPGIAAAMAEQWGNYLKTLEKPSAMAKK